MRKTWMIVTVALAAVILTAGVLLLPVVYAGIFDAGKIIYEEEALPEELIMAPELFMDRFRYPLQEETESMPKAEREVHVADCRNILGPEIYERAFALVGLEEEERYWDALSAVKGSVPASDPGRKGRERVSFGCSYERCVDSLSDLL